MGAVGSSVKESTSYKTNSNSGIEKLEKMTIGKAMTLTKKQLENLKVGTLINASTRWNENGTLRYATWSVDENMPIPENYKERRKEIQYGLQTWLKKNYNEDIKLSDIDVNENNIVVWRENGDKDIFSIKSAMQPVEIYIEPNLRFNKKKTDKLYVQRRREYTINFYEFEFQGRKEY